MNYTERLISEISHLHLEYSQDFLNKSEYKKLNLSHSIKNIPIEYILQYRLDLHESINDYLMQTENLMDIPFFYRVKTSERILRKIDYFAKKEKSYPVNSWMNDIFGCRIILSSDEISEVEGQLDNWKEKYSLKNWYKRGENGYKGIHVYFKNKNNLYFPWELQIWDRKDVISNIESHKEQKRKFILDSGK